METNCETAGEVETTLHAGEEVSGLGSSSVVEDLNKIDQVIPEGEDGGQAENAGESTKLPESESVVELPQTGQGSIGDSGAEKSEVGAESVDAEKSDQVQEKVQE